MEHWERELHVARIIAGKTRIVVDNTVLYVVNPTLHQKLIACEVYRDARRDAELDGALTEQELLRHLIHQKIWTLKDAEEVDKLTKAIEDMKVGLFENRLKSNAKLSIRNALQKAKNELSRLEVVKHGLDYVTVDGLALSAKHRYLTGASIQLPNGNPYWGDDSWNRVDPFVDKVMDALAYERLSESQFRELARNEPWRSIWGAKTHAGEGVLGRSAIELSDEQRNLLLWSTIYDNIREYPDSPNDNIIDDDDMIDGWMIIQRRNREAKSASQEANRIGNDKIRNADEQFIFVDTLEDAKMVDKMNDPMGAATKAQRLAFLKAQGEVHEGNMPDSSRRIAMEFNKMEQTKMRQGK